VGDIPKAGAYSQRLFAAWRGGCVSFGRYAPSPPLPPQPAPLLPLSLRSFGRSPLFVARSLRSLAAPSLPCRSVGRRLSFGRSLCSLPHSRSPSVAAAVVRSQPPLLVYPPHPRHQRMKKALTLLQTRHYALTTLSVQIYINLQSRDIKQIHYRLWHQDFIVLMITAR